MSLLLLLLGCPPPSEAPTEPCTGSTAVALADGVVSALHEGCGSVRLSAEVIGEGDLSVELVVDDGAIVPVVSGTGTFRGLVARGPIDLAGRGDPVLWRQGYQSWAWSGVTALEPLQWSDEGWPVTDGDGDAFSLAFEHPSTSWWGGLLGKAGGGSVLLGALSASRTKVYTAFTSEEAVVVWGGRGEAIPLGADGTLTLDPVGVFIGGDAHELHVEWAQSTRVTPRPLRTPSPVGWATWYTFYSDLQGHEVTSNLEFATAWASEGAPLDLFQIDDGYQVLWGQWEANSEFPQGLDGLAAQIDDAGFTPGIWMAPLYVHRDAPAYQQHDDWWVTDLAGDELSFSNAGTGDYAVLDVTHPDAAAWLRDVVEQRVSEGWRYFKFDFLYAAAQEGRRHQDVTGTEAYHIAMQLLREASGDSWMLACGAPLLPSVGYFESYRSGADIAFEFSPGPTLPFMRSQGRSTGARAWAGGVWWWNDPDQILVREPFNQAQARGAIVNQAISGGPWLLGDDLPTLPDDRLALTLHPAALATRDQRVRPLHPLTHVSGFDAGPIGETTQQDDDVPTRWRFEDGTEVWINYNRFPVDVDGVTLEPGEGRGFWE